MSVEAMAHVFRNPTDNAATTLVWLAMGDSVNDQYDFDFWMSNAKLSAKTGLHEDTVRRCLHRLVAMELVELLEERKGATTRYRFLFATPGRLQGDPPQDAASDPPQDPTQTQVLTQEKPNCGKSISEELWDALCLACKINDQEITKTGRGELNAAVKELKSVGATPREIITRSVAWGRKYPNIALTPSALKKHWATLGPPPLANNVTELYPGTTTPVVLPGAVVQTPEERERNQAKIRELSERFRSERT